MRFSNTTATTHSVPMSKSNRGLASSHMKYRVEQWNKCASRAKSETGAGVAHQHGADLNIVLHRIPHTLPAQPRLLAAAVRLAAHTAVSSGMPAWCLSAYGATCLWLTEKSRICCGTGSQVADGAGARSRCGRRKVVWVAGTLGAGSIASPSWATHCTALHHKLVVLASAARQTPRVPRLHSSVLRIKSCP